MEDKSRNIFVVIIALIMVAAVFYSFAINLFGDTPSVELADISKQPDSTASASGDMGNMVRIEVTPDTVQSVIQTLDRYVSYQRSVMVEYLDGEQTLGTLIAQVAVDNGWTRVDAVGQNGMVEHTIVGMDTRWLWYDDDSAYVSMSADRTAADQAQRLPTYEDVLALDKADITATSYVIRGELPCIYVEVDQAELGYLERYWVSVESGLLVSSETVKDGKLVYRMTSYQVVSPLVDAADSFTLPDGVVLHQAEG